MLEGRVSFKICDSYAFLCSNTVIFFFFFISKILIFIYPYLILDMPVGDLIANRSTFVDIMVTNLSLPRDDLELFLNSTLDAEKVIVKQTQFLSISTFF